MLVAQAGLLAVVLEKVQMDARFGQLLFNLSRNRFYEKPHEFAEGILSFIEGTLGFSGKMCVLDLRSGIETIGSRGLNENQFPPEELKKNILFRFSSVRRFLYYPEDRSLSWFNEPIISINQYHFSDHKLLERYPRIGREIENLFHLFQKAGFTHCLPVANLHASFAFMLFDFGETVNLGEKEVEYLKLATSIFLLGFSPSSGSRVKEDPKIDLNENDLVQYDFSRLPAPRKIEIGPGKSILYLSNEMDRAVELANVAARTDRIILLLGESGTGKELFASMLHRNSGLKGPFVALNCAAIPPSLMEDELFGHEKGAFTGANRQHTGRFEESNEGTLFLDEIGELPLSLQAGLLRIIQERLFRRVGGESMLKWTGRLILATNRDLMEMVRERTFREDLYYRINVVTIRLPPLRERREDILPLAEHFINMQSLSPGRKISGISEETKKILTRYDWPGNIRELENVISQAFVTCKSNIITSADIPAAIKKKPTIQTVSKEFERPGGYVPYDDYMKDKETHLLQAVLKQTHGNKTEAAILLNMNRNTLTYRVKKLGLMD